MVKCVRVFLSLLEIMSFDVFNLILVTFCMRSLLYRFCVVREISDDEIVFFAMYGKPSCTHQLKRNAYKQAKNIWNNGKIMLCLWKRVRSTHLSSKSNIIAKCTKILYTEIKKRKSFFYHFVAIFFIFH